MAFVDDPGARDATSLLAVSEADTLATDSFDGTEWTGLTTGQKQGALLEATRVFETFRFHGERVWPELQALQWPREDIEHPDLAFELMGVIHRDTTNRVLDREQTSFTHEGLGSKNQFSATSLIGQPFEPTTFWVNGGIRCNSQGASLNEVRRIQTFTSTTGTVVTVSNFTETLAAGTRFSMVQELHPTVKQAVFELAKMIAREGAGWVDRKEDRDPFFLMTGIVDRFLRGIRRRRFNVV